ncbi:WXG100 family type VII secretion target [Streptomyces zagrosensis]|uniref:WXG100 family type VII secretion target n=1 Tax=Streptomyces zagrosensis TaxID=1042984 RepID=A0A7W9UYD3_9ACTN|nr:WXG100 family type VII secretion target [Streptomyces zagrosensis]MBB5934679.1 WXG100 family type VII secretion target [Streptomyces zagrosensis]
MSGDMDRGASLEKLKSLYEDFDKKAGELAALVKALNTKTTGSESYWKGPKANSFRDEWGNVKPTFDKFVETLHSASKSARTSHDNIERAT